MANTKLNNKKVVCLGGGIGTVNLVKGLKDHFKNVSIVFSMADDGGSGGRLRRLYNVPPIGDIVSCMSALISSSNPTLSDLLIYRFPGERYGKDEELGGHKLGNLVLIAMLDKTDNLEKAIQLYQKTFDIPGTFLPVTHELVSISAKTIEGKNVVGEEVIDLGKFEGQKQYEHLYLHPSDAKASPQALKQLEEADIIIAGPGDLYSTLLPTLLFDQVKQVLKHSKAKKIFVSNITNKPEETEGYSVAKYIDAIKKHLDGFPFNKVIANNNVTISIPSKYKNEYSYVSIDPSLSSETIIQEDLVDESFPLYHDSSKLAKTILKEI